MSSKGIVHKLKSGEQVIIFDDLESLGLKEGDIIEFQTPNSETKTVSFKKIERVLSEEELRENQFLQPIINAKEEGFEK